MSRGALSVGAVSFFAVHLVSADNARALENEPAYRPGITEGIPVGAALPPGWYFGQTSTFYQGQKQNGNGDNSPLHVSINKEVTTFNATWVPGIEILGASYSFMVVQPVATVSVNVGGGTGSISTPVGPIEIPVAGSKTSGSGWADTGFYPVNLSWTLADHWYATGSLGFYAPDGTYKPTSRNVDAVNIGNGYWTLEPSLGLTYLTPDWHLSANLVYDKAFENNHTSTILTTGGGTMSGHYQSGDMLMVDFGAVRFVDKWSLGLTGYYATQVNDDEIDGEAVPAMSIPGLGNTRGEGNRYEKLGLGPMIGYDFGSLRVTGYYNRDVIANNTLKADSFWLRTSFKLP